VNEVVDDSFLTIWVTIRGGIGEMLLVAILRGMQGFLVLGRTPEYASRSFLIQARIVIIDKRTVTYLWCLSRVCTFGVTMLDVSVTNAASAKLRLHN